MNNAEIYSKLAQHFIGLRADDIMRNRDNYPIYDVLHYYDEQGSVNYQIDVAVAGFKTEDLDVCVKQGSLVIASNDIQNPAETNITYVKKSIAKRKFELVFRLEKNLVVDKVVHKCGVLSVILTEVQPKEPLVKKIPIIPE